MSELIQKNDNRATIRWKLLTGASALALTAYVSSTAFAKADDADHPQVWIELGGQLSSLKDGQETFAPDFPNSPPRPSIFSPSQKFEKPPLYSIDETGKISFQPENSDWIFSASVRIGRSTSDRRAHQQTYPVAKTFPSSIIRIPRKPNAARFADTEARNSEQHTILDFEAGKDVGLGMLGSKEGSSNLSLGVRIAQFRSKSNIALKSDPDWHFQAKTLTLYYYTTPTVFNFHNQPYHSNAASFRADRRFRGVGPSLSWNASMPFAGNSQDGELTLDWGFNAAVLFGRQKTRTQHQMTEHYNSGATFASAVIGFGRGVPHLVAHTAPPASTRSRSVTVPNVGGFAGLSYKYADAKLSFGYKADFFFNAIDGGIDARKNENRGFFGPYASISVGLGD